MTQSTSNQALGVHGFLDDRQRLIVQIMKLTSEIDDHHHDIVEALLIRFCQRMIDYLSNGHFQIFSNLFPHSNDVTVPPEYEILDGTTEIAMRFHDQYASNQRFSLDTLRANLEELTLALETRFEHDDELIQQSMVARLSA